MRLRGGSVSIGVVRRRAGASALATAGAAVAALPFAATLAAGLALAGAEPLVPTAVPFASGLRRKRPVGRLRSAAPGSSTPSACPTSRISSPAELWRSSGVFERAERSTSSMAGGSSGRSADSFGGGPPSWACMAARLDWRAKGADPDRHV